MLSVGERREAFLRRLRAARPEWLTVLGRPTAFPRRVSVRRAEPRICKPHICKHSLPDDLVNELTECAARLDVRPEEVATAALVATVGCYAGERELIVGLHWPARGLASPRALSLTVGNRSFADLVADTHQALRLLAAAQVAEIFAAARVVVSIADEPVERFAPPPDAAHYDGTTVFGLARQGAVLTLRYDTGYLDPAFADRVLSHCETLLRRALATPDTAVGGHDVLGATDVELALAINADTSRPVEPTSLGDRLDAAIRAYAGRQAVTDGAGALTYAELGAAVRHLAAYLRTLTGGDDPESRVAVLVPQDDRRWILACLAALYAGHAWLPMDVVTPPARLADRLRETSPRAIVTIGGLLDRIPVGHWDVIDLDAAADAIAACSPASAPARLMLQDAAYCLVTSGSTGTPRVVVVEHRNLVNFLACIDQEFGIGPDDRVIQYASPGFDVSVFEIFGALLAGASLVLPSHDDRLSIPGLTRFLRDARITVAEIPPVLAELIDPGAVPELRLLSLGGEPFPGSLVMRWADGRHRVLNGYGTTETTIGSIYKECAGDLAGAPPIGRPTVNHTVYILDDRMRLVPPGAVGDLYVAGASVARGYLGKPGWTAERFVPCPFTDDGSRMYRTGDRAALTAEGDLLFVGRRDRQVKVRGQRVELGDIESAFAGIAGVKQAVVGVTEDPQSQRQTLTAYVVASAGHDLDRAALRAILRDRLPAHMVPNTIVGVNELPLTPSGKIDLASLARAHQPTLRQRLRTVCFDLALPGVHIDDGQDFFSAGGTSLDAIRILAHIHHVTGVEIPLAEFLAQPSLGRVTELVERRLSFDEGRAGDRAGRLASEDRVPDATPLTFAQGQIWLLNQLSPRPESLNVLEAYRIRGDLDVARLARALAHVCRAHGALRTAFPERDGRPWPEVRSASAVRSDASLTVLHVGDGAATLDVLGDELATPFSVATGPLLRAVLLRSGPAENVLALTMHHIISDLRSTEVLVEDLAAAYRSDAAPSALPVAVDAVGQRERRRRNLDHWRRRLRQAPLRFTLPADCPRPSRRTYDGASFLFTIPPALVDRAHAVSCAVGASLFQALLAAFAVTTCARARTREAVIGVPLLGRDRVALDRVIGCYSSSLPLHIQLADDPSFAALVQRVGALTLDALAHQEVDAQQLVEALGLRPDLSYEPLFQVLFALYDDPERLFVVPGLAVERLQLPLRTALCDLTVELRRRADGRIDGLANYSTDLFEPATIDDVVAQYLAVAEQLFERPHEPLSTSIPKTYA
jgi:amino acid adenylation domain-containing protein